MKFLFALGVLLLAPTVPASAEDRHAEPGWKLEWTKALSSAVGGYAVDESGGRKTAWYAIFMRDTSFRKAYCPRYNKLPAPEKRAFLIEVFKAVAFAESGWDPAAVSAANPGAQGLFQMSVSDMEFCGRISGGDIKPRPREPLHAIPCAVLKLMPVFYSAGTFGVQRYKTKDGTVQNNHFEVLYPIWGGATGVKPELHRKLSERVNGESFPDCFRDGRPRP